MFEMTNSNKSVFIDQNTSHIKHGWQAKRMIMEYNACVSCALIGHNFPTVVQCLLLTHWTAQLIRYSYRVIVDMHISPADPHLCPASSLQWFPAICLGESGWTSLLLSPGPMWSVFTTRDDVGACMF